MPETLTLYTAKACPYAHRVELALEEVKAPYTEYKIDLQNKPTWFATKVNGISKVPAIAYGGPKVPADQPSPESTKLTESLVLLEFVADLYPDSNLLPKDPVQRAKVRFFIDALSNKVLPTFGGYFSGVGFRDISSGAEYLQSLLPATGFAVGEYSMADIAVAPFIARLKVFASKVPGVFPEEDAAIITDIFESPKFARLQQYWSDLKARPSFTATFDEAHVSEVFQKRMPKKK